MDIESVRERIKTGNYLIKSHVAQHALKEGFERQHIVEAILGGMIIEEYPDDQRGLICGKSSLSASHDIYLHVIYEYSDTVYLEIVTAYIPDELLWESPPLRRRRRKKR